MPTGRIQPPNLDDRSWEQIVEEIKARIPTVAPEWTDFNPSDPGITMIELFSYIAEMIIYRLNRVPEKNYIEFLNLLDITRDPPTPATVELTFELSADKVDVPKGTQVSTVPNEQEDAIVFETDEEKTLTKENNKIKATNALTIRQPEVIGYGTGETYQVYGIKNVPLYLELNKPNPWGHLEIRVDDKIWTRVDEFSEGQNEHYRCNPVTGEVIFGDGNIGGIPAQSAEIVATSYRYVIGGIRSNVPANSLTLLKSPVPGIKSVTNLLSASGGSDWEDIEDTKRRAPQQIKSRYRAVTKEDYEFLTKEATNEVAKVRCLGPKKKA
ncbi:MAG: baseplate J/gp47 family protein, partial [Candidatus Thorarchaeota archaeon]